MLSTRITQLLGIRHPILQGAMQWLSRAELAAAVSNAGGLGILSALTFPGSKELREEIRKTRNLTSKPFAVNVTLLPTSRQVNYGEYFAVALEEGVKVIETAGRSPEPYLKQIRDGGAKLLHKVARIRDALTAERLGVDAVTIVGFEAGGHPSADCVTSFILIPEAADGLKIPLIAAGGIGDSRGLVAALALGAEGVMLGTRFVATRECPAHPRFKEWLLQASDRDTILLERSINNMGRFMKTAYAQKVLEMEEKGATLAELLPYISGERGRKALQEGDTENAVIPCGQVAALLHHIPSVKEVIENLVADADRVMSRLCRDAVLSGGP
ncbi:MAG: nitronate monooxygenase family protein [Dehalococcoidia bacterium]|nr:nitronate monooxygenase family protein [Dehalococcoidia bacterium]